MKANRLIMIGLIAASLLAGCKKKDDNNTNSHLNMDGISFSASTEQHDRNTRTYLEGEDIKWMNGDKILVTNSANQQGEFEVTGGIRTTNGTFHSANDFDQAPEYNAAYPFGIASISGTTATFTMSGTQTITATGTFANGAMPMVAHSDDETLNFRNVFGGLCLPIKGAGISVTKIVLTSSNTNEMLWGTFNADCTSSEPNPTNISGGTNVLELVCNPAIELQGAQSQDFVFMIPEGTLQTGFTFAVYSIGTEPVYSKTVNFPDDNFDPERFLINRSRIRKVNTDINIEAALEVETYSPTFISYDKAWMGGTVTGGTPTECGVIYATYDELGGNHPENLVLSRNIYKVPMTDDLSGSDFNGWVESLVKNTIYFVRSYAISASGGIYYGDPIAFSTRRDYANEYNGTLQGRFSVSPSKQVSFAMGNLQYNNTDWRYAEYQFEYVGGEDIGQGVMSGNVYIDGEDPVLPREKCNNYAMQEDQRTSTQWYDYFAWGTSGKPESGIEYYQPWTRVRNPNPSHSGLYNNENFQNEHFYIFGNMETDLTGTVADWAVNIIINGDADDKYTGSAAEWNYLTKERPASTVNSIPNARFAFAELTVRKDAKVNGIFLFPDSFVWPELVDNQLSLINEEYQNMTGEFTNWQLPEGNHFTEAQWSLLEHNDLVFLPAAGCYGITGSVEWTNAGGRYWTSDHRPLVDPNPYSGAYDFAFSPKHHYDYEQGGEGIVNPYAKDERYIGFTVRFMIP